MKRPAIGMALLLVSLFPGLIPVTRGSEESLATVFGRGTATYQLVLLSEAWQEEPIPENRAARLGTTRRFVIEQLVRDDVALIEGPVEHDGDLKEVLIMNAGSTAEAQRIMGIVPSVEAGELQADVYALLAPKDVLKKPADPTDRDTCYLGLIKRAPNSARTGEIDTEEVERGHLENVRKMVAEGDVVLAGPVEEGGDLRGILIFRTTDRKRIDALMARDPAIRFGRFAIELYPWSVPKGTLPEPGETEKATEVQKNEG